MDAEKKSFKNPDRSKKSNQLFVFEKLCGPTCAYVRWQQGDQMSEEKRQK
jgi:hypothetical protein